MHGIENSNRNRQAVITSAIIAKAVVQRENGRINIIVVFQNSTRHEFYWIFQAKSARSARRSWKFVCFYGRDFNSDFKAYVDFQTFVSHYSKTNSAKVLTMRVHQVRRLAALRAKTLFESIHGDWQTRIESNDPRDFRKLNKALGSRMKGRSIDWSM